MLRLSNRLILVRQKSHRKIVLKDDQGHEVVSNWPRVFGPGVHQSGPKAGLPISEETWNLGNNLTKGRATTFRTQSRWPKPEQIMPLRKKLPQPLEGDEAKDFAHQSDIDMFPDPAGVVKKVDTVYYTEPPKEITIEGIDLAETSNDNDQRPKKTSRDRVCPLESRFISVTPKDVLILAQFINSDGTMRTQEQTGLSDKQYRIVSEAVFIAQNDGLLPVSRYSYFENRTRWRVQLVDNMNENRTKFGTPSSPEIMNRYNSNSLHGSKQPVYTKGQPWFRAYVNSYSELLAEETPYGLPKERTQKVSTSTCMSNVYQTDMPSYWDNHGVRAKRMRLGPFNHGTVAKKMN